MKLIRTSYEIFTPESTEDGDAADRGWIDEEGQDMTPDQYDVEDCISAVHNAIKFLKYFHVEASASHFHDGIWYTGKYDEDYSTGEVEYRSYHLVGFTIEEQEEIFKSVKAS